MSSRPRHADAPLFALFWENSKLGARTAERFAERLDEDARLAGQVAQLFYSGADIPLARADDALARVMERRRSRRAFSRRPLTLAELASLCAGFRSREGGGRLIASAGGKYPVEVFAFLYRVAGLDGAAVYYNGDAHALTRIGAAPAWSDARGAFGLPTVDQAPAALFVLAGFPSRVCARYGERGGRFLLYECGYHAHALALRLAHEGLAGVESGGLYDDDVKRWLGLDGTDAVIALGYAVGAPAD
jgi:SagB-type dehydrogenase family enzyme